MIEFRNRQTTSKKFRDDAFRGHQSFPVVQMFPKNRRGFEYCLSCLTRENLRNPLIRMYTELN